MEGSSARRKRSAQVLLPHYILGKTIGSGSSAKVKIAQHVLTRQDVAVKILDLQKLDDSETERVRREIKIMAALSHPHIVRLYEVLEKRSKIYIIMEYINWGELYYYITENGRVHEDKARYIFQQIISGVEFCHSNMVAHRDLKPENVLVDSKLTVKLADFGLSNVMHDGHFLKTSCGSPSYAAPEVLSGKLYAGPEVDVWSCGVILYVLLCGRLPFEDNDLSRFLTLIKNGIYTMPSHLSPGARDLIARILLANPMKRITIPEIHCHPWFQYHLPRYMSVPAEEIREITKKINEEVLQEATSIGVSRNFLIESLQKRIQNEATVTYYLLLDKASNFSGTYQFGFYEELEEGPSSSFTSSLSMQPYVDNAGISSRLQFSAGRNWTPGLKSPTHPRELMINALRVFQHLNVCWKEIGHYNMKCKWLPDFSSSLERTPSLDINRVPSNESSICSMDGSNLLSHNAVKFEMQLYEVSEDEYLLDLQRISGPPLLFLEICASFLADFQYNYYQHTLMEALTYEKPVVQL